MLVDSDKTGRASSILKIRGRLNGDGEGVLLLNRKSLIMKQAKYCLAVCPLVFVGSQGC